MDNIIVQFTQKQNEIIMQRHVFVHVVVVIM